MHILCQNFKRVCIFYCLFRYYITNVEFLETLGYGGIKSFSKFGWGKYTRRSKCVEHGKNSNKHWFVQLASIKIEMLHFLVWRGGGLKSELHNNLS